MTFGTTYVKVPPTLYTTAGQEITVTTVALKQQCVHIQTKHPTKKH